MQARAFHREEYGRKGIVYSRNKQTVAVLIRPTQVNNNTFQVVLPPRTFRTESEALNFLQGVLNECPR